MGWKEAVQKDRTYASLQGNNNLGRLWCPKGLSVMSQPSLLEVQNDGSRALSCIRELPLREIAR